MTHSPHAPALAFRCSVVCALAAAAFVASCEPGDANAPSNDGPASGGADAGTSIDGAVTTIEGDAGAGPDTAPGADAGPPGGDSGTPAGDSGTPAGDSGTPADDDAGTQAGTDAGMPPDDVVRFVVIGDTGRVNSARDAVAAAMGRVCAEAGGCDFGLMGGDNFMESGVSSTTDSQWQTKFVEPYGELGFPFYAVLGNHDYGGSHGTRADRAQHQIDYSARDPRWRMPSYAYEFTHGPVSVIAIDTQPFFTSDMTADSTYPEANLAVMRERAAQQRDWLPAQLASARGTWKVVFGHHPYRSNGPHGNAGRYDGRSGGAGAGEPVKSLIESAVCGKADFYFSGHDHSLQDLGEVCGTNFIVSGAAAYPSTISDRNPALYQSVAPGFVLAEATSTAMKVSFHDQTGRRTHTRTVSR